MGAAASVFDVVTTSKLVNWFASQLNSNIQLTFTSSKSAIETLEKGVKYVQNLTLKTPKRRH